MARGGRRRCPRHDTCADDRDVRNAARLPGGVDVQPGAAHRRQLGHYALPLLWGERIPGWGNVSVRQGRVVPELGYVAGKAPRDRAFRAALEADLARLEAFLGTELE